MQMDPHAQLRNFRDFLTLYNQMTENCFSRCVDEMNSRSLNRDEERCVNNCSSKFISSNHRMMSVYVDVQSTLVTKRIEEAEAAAAAAANQETSTQQIQENSTAVEQN